MLATTIHSSASAITWDDLVQFYDAYAKLDAQKAVPEGAQESTS